MFFELKYDIFTLLQVKHRYRYRGTVTVGNNINLKIKNTANSSNWKVLINQNCNNILFRVFNGFILPFSPLGGGESTCLEIIFVCFVSVLLGLLVELHDGGEHGDAPALVGHLPALGRLAAQSPPCRLAL